MRAIICPRYGAPDLLEMRELPTPVPGPKQVLVRVYATTVTSGDWRVRSGNFPRGFGWIATLAVGLKGPRQPILGTELAGVVEAVGPAVTRFKVGDAVIGFAGASMGCHAEFRCFAEDGLLVAKPPDLTFEEAASLSFGATTAIDFLRRARLQPGEHVLVNGASGGVGTAVVQIARHLGAHVTGVCSAANVELVTSLGAHRVIDYTREDFTRDAARYDVVVDTVGNAPYGRSKRVLNDRGRLALVLATLADNLGGLWVAMTSRHRVVGGPANVRAEDLHTTADLAAKGILRPVIDRRFPFERFADAHRHVDAGHKRGSVVITIDARADQR